jgi:hypothetical protein
MYFHGGTLASSLFEISEERTGAVQVSAAGGASSQAKGQQ